MRTLSDARELQPASGRVCCAIGMFDGVHLGHQQVIRQAVSDAHQLEATSLCVTFDRHPATVVAPERAPLLIQSLNQRLAAIEALGVEATLVLPFDEFMSQIPAEAFVRGLAVDLGRLQSVCVGAHFAFGHQRDDLVHVGIGVNIVQAHPYTELSQRLAQFLHARFQRAAIPEAGAVFAVDAVGAGVL